MESNQVCFLIDSHNTYFSIERLNPISFIISVCIAFSLPLYYDTSNFNPYTESVIKGVYAAEPYNELASPLDQFEILNLLSLDAPILAHLHISLTNIALYLTIAASIVITLNFLLTSYNKVVANS